MSKEEEPKKKSLTNDQIELGNAVQGVGCGIVIVAVLGFICWLWFFAF